MENKLTKNKIHKIKKQFRKGLNIETNNITYLSFDDRIKLLYENTNNKKLFLFIFGESIELKSTNKMLNSNYDFVIGYRDAIYGIYFDKIDDYINYFKKLITKDDDNCIICYENTIEMNLNFVVCPKCITKVCENCFEKIYNCPVCKDVYDLKSIKEENLFCKLFND